MPAAYTHYRFGKDVLNCLPLTCKKILTENRALFDIGLHGPDILFYYKPLSHNPVNRLGYGMHERPADEFFRKAADLYKNTEDPDAFRSYLYGFICHFALDSACHPYIEKMEHDSGLSHAEIETELERHFMLIDRKDPASYIPIGHIHATDEASRIIAPCFEPLAPADILASLKGMIRSHKLLHAPKNPKRNILYLGLRLAGKYDSMQGLIMKPEANEACGNYCLLLGKLYREAVTVASSLIRQYAGVLNGAGDLSPRFSFTFGAGDGWKELLI